MNAITRTPPNAEDRMVATMQNSLYPGANPNSIRMVIAYCHQMQLDPMLKPVHIVSHYTKKAGYIDIVMPGIALYRILAARSGDYGGKSEPLFGPERTEKMDGVQVVYPEWCKITVKRGAAEFTAVERWTENYATVSRESAAPNTMWRKRAYGQLAKCTEAQALRMAFPEATGGEVTAEEMEGKAFAGPTIEAESVVSTATAEPPAPNAISDYVEKMRYVEKIRGWLERADTSEKVAAVDRKWRSSMSFQAAPDATKAEVADMIRGRLEMLETPTDKRFHDAPPHDDDLGLDDPDDVTNQLMGKVP